MVTVIDTEPLDDLGKLYRAVRDIVRNADVEQAEKIAVCELVKFELLRDTQEQIDPSLP